MKDLIALLLLLLALAGIFLATAYALQPVFRLWQMARHPGLMNIFTADGMACVFWIVLAGIIWMPSSSSTKEKFIKVAEIPEGERMKVVIPPGGKLMIEKRDDGTMIVSKADTSS